MSKEITKSTTNYYKYLELVVGADKVAIKKAIAEKIDKGGLTPDDKGKIQYIKEILLSPGKNEAQSIDPNWEYVGKRAYDECLKNGLEHQISKEKALNSKEIGQTPEEYEKSINGEVTVENNNFGSIITSSVDFKSFSSDFSQLKVSDNIFI